jgi:hypothetical protein
MEPSRISARGVRDRVDHAARHPDAALCPELRRPSRRSNRLLLCHDTLARSTISNSTPLGGAIIFEIFIRPYDTLLTPIAEHRDPAEPRRPKGSRAAEGGPRPAWRPEQPPAALAPLACPVAAPPRPIGHSHYLVSGCERGSCERNWPRSTFGLIRQ